MLLNLSHPSIRDSLLTPCFHGSNPFPSKTCDTNKWIFLSFEGILMPELTRYFAAITNPNMAGSRVFLASATGASWNDACNWSWKNTEFLIILMFFVSFQITLDHTETCGVYLSCGLGGDQKPKTGMRYGKLRVEMSHEMGVLQIWSIFRKATITNMATMRNFNVLKLHFFRYLL